jgi:hypothetical protein
MVLFLLIEMAGNNTVAAAENGTDVAKNGAAAIDGNDVAAALKKVIAVDKDGAVAAANMAGKGDQKRLYFR